MAAKDTQLLGDILSVQKAILSKMNESEKKDKEKEKKSAKVEEAQVEAQGFAAMIKELQTLNKTADQQLEELKGIREAVGGMGSSGGDSLKIKGSLGDDLGSLGSGLVTLGMGILAIVGGIAALALVAVITPMAMVGAVGVGIIVYGFYKLFKKVGDPETKEQVDDGLENLFRMAGGIAIFTLAIVASTLAMEAVGGGAIVKNLVLALIGFGSVFYILGKGAESIKDGAYAAAAMGFGLAVLGLGVLAMVWSLKQAGELLGGGGAAAVAVGGLAALAIVAVAGVTFFIMGEVAREIAMGSLAAAAIGFGLAAFGLGLTVYLSGIAKIMGVGGGGVMGGTQVTGGFFDTLGSMLVGLGIIATGAVTLMLYGSIFALAGLFEFGVPLMIMAGAGAFAVAGLGLMFFGLGLDVYLGVIKKNIGVSGEGSGQTISAESFGSGVVVMGGAIGMLIGVGGTMALAGLFSPLIALGAGAMGLAGLALYGLGEGIANYLEKVPPGTDIAEELKTTLKGIRDAFLTFVGEENLAEQGILGSIGGLISGGAKSLTLAAAMASAMLIGPVLSSIAYGIGAWADLQNIPKIKGFDKDGQPIYEAGKTANVEVALQNITDYLPKIIQPFIDISKQAKLDQNQGNLLTMLTGASLGSTPFERGIRASTMIGEVLSEIAAGVAAWMDLENLKRPLKDSKGLIIGYQDSGDIGTAIANIHKVLEVKDGSETSVIQPFIDLAKKSGIHEKGMSLFSLISGADLGSTPFEKGISASVQIGEVLTAIATGIGAFANLQGIPLIKSYDAKGKPIYSDKVADVDTAIANINTVLSLDSSESVIKPFVDLAQKSGIMERKTSLLSLMVGADFGSSPFERGISASSSIGNVLSSLAAGISSFMNLQSIPRVKGYDPLGNPIFDEGKPTDVEAAIRNVAAVLDVDGGDMSILSPFIKLAEKVASTKPKSLLSWVTEAVAGVNPSASPLEQGITLGLQIGEIISNVGSGMGQMANLAAIPVITGYDANGRPTYGKPVNALNSVANFGKIMGDLIIAFADAARRAGPYADPESLEGLGPTIGGILGAVADSLDIFSNPNKIKKIKGYDEKGRPIFYTGTSPDDFVNIDQVINTMNEVVIKIIKAFGTEEIEDAMDNLDIDEDEMIGTYLEMFLKPISGFAKIVGELNGKGQNLYTLTDEIIYSTLTFIKKFGNLDYDAIDNMEEAGDALDDFSSYIVSGYEDLLDFDVTNPGFYTSDTNPKGSALRGVSENLAYSVFTITSAFAPDNTLPQLTTALAGSQIVNDILENMKKFPAYMRQFLGAKPNDFGDGAKAAFDGLFVITQVAEKGAGKGYTHMKLFTDQMNRLANIATPFEKFANSFGKMAKDMGVFAENFSLMDERGIMAFKEWTDSIVTLSTANPDTFAANVVTANKAIDAGFNAGEDEGLVDTIVNAFTGDDKSKGEKQDIINKNTTPQPPKGAGDGKPVKMPSAAEIGAAVANALKGATIDVYISGKKQGLKLS